ncbi:hypothetical protein ACVWWR_000657 [Bradyrhizobium sp. LM3.2]
MFAPKGTSPAIIARLNAAAVKALDDATVRKRLLELGSVIPAPADPDAGGAGDPRQERDREVDPGAQAGKLASRIKSIGEGRHVSSAPCRLRREHSFFRV